MKVVILPSDEKTPYQALKSTMTKIGGVPIIFHIIKMLEGAGAQEIILCDNSSDSDLEEYLNNSKDSFTNLKINYFRVPSELKSGEILTLCEKYDLENTFFVVPNDVITDLDLKKALDFHRKNGRVATVCVAESKKYFVALGEGDAYESKIVNSGFYVFENEIIDYSSGRASLDPEILLRVAEDDELSIYKDGSFIQRCTSALADI